MSIISLADSDPMTSFERSGLDTSLVIPNVEDEIHSEMNFEQIVGKSAALQRVLRQVETVAPTESTVMIYGETGTGKELVARALHNLSSSATKKAHLRVPSRNALAASS